MIGPSLLIAGLLEGFAPFDILSCSALEVGLMPKSHGQCQEGTQEAVFKKTQLCLGCRAKATPLRPPSQAAINARKKEQANAVENTSSDTRPQASKTHYPPIAIAGTTVAYSREPHTPFSPPPLGPKKLRRTIMPC